MKVGDKIKILAGGNTGGTGTILEIAPCGYMDAESGLTYIDQDGCAQWTYQDWCQVLPESKQDG